jgi:PAS domain S-box-containing protein
MAKAKPKQSELTKNSLFQQNLQLLMINTEESFVMVDTDYKIVAFNFQFEKQYQLYFNKEVIVGDDIVNYTLPERRHILKGIYDKVFKGEIFETQFPIYGPDKKEHIFSIRYKPAYDENATIIGAFVSSIDITELKQSEEKNAFVSKIIQDSLNEIYIFNAETLRFEFVNSGALQNLRYSIDEMKLKTPLDIKPEFTYNEFLSLLQPLQLKQTEKIVFETIHKRADKSTYNVEVHLQLREYKKRQVYIAFILDISERKRIEKNRKEEFANSVALINSTNDLIWSITHDYKLIKANDSFINNIFKLSGKKLKPGDDVLLFENFGYDFVHYWKQQYDKALQGETITFEINTPSATDKQGEWSLINMNPIFNNGKVMSISCFGRNITQSKKQEQHILDINTKLETAQSIAQMGYWEFDTNTELFYWSSEVFSIFEFENNGKPPSYQKFYNAIIKEDRAKFIHSRANDLEEVIYRISTQNNKIKYILHKVNNLKNNDRPTIIEGTIQDVTKQILAEEKLINEKIILRAIIDNLPDYIFVKDINGKHIVNNKKSYFEILGAEWEKDTLGKTVFDYFDEERAEGYFKDDKQILNGKKNIVTIQESFIDTNGDKQWLSTSKVPLKNAEDKIIGIVGIARNITERYMKIQEQQLVNNVLSALHETNNLKKSMRMAIQLIAEYIDYQAAETWILGKNNNKLLQLCHWCNSSQTNKLFSNHSISFEQGVGLPGIAWKNKQISYWDNLSYNKYFVRKKEIKETGLNAAICIPISIHKDIIAVLTFFTNSTKKLNANTEFLLHQLSLQIGIDIQRKKSINELNNFFIHSPNLTGIAGPDGFFKKVNPAFRKILGYTEKEMLKIPFIDLVHPDDIEATLKVFESNQAGNKTILFENRYKTKSGKWKWISWYSSEWLEDDNMIYAFGDDITHIKEANLSLLKYKNVIDNSQDGIGIISLIDKKVILNKSLKKTLGYNETEIEKMGGPFILYTNNRLSAEVPNTLLNGKFWKGDIQLKTKSGKIVDFHLSAGPIYNDEGKLIAIFGIHTDISLRIRHEKELESYNKKITNILDSINDGFITLDNNWHVTYWNKQAEILLQVKKEEILGKNIWGYFDDATKLLFYKEYHRAKKENISVHFEEYYPGANKWFDVSAHPSPDGIAVYFKDVTERKNNEDKIRFAKERYDLAAKATNDAIWDLNLETNTLEWGQGFNVLFGIDGGTINTYELWEKLVHKEDIERVNSSLAQAIKDKNALQWSDEYRLIKRDDSYAFVYDRGFIIRNAKGKAIRIIGALQDISQRKKDEVVLIELNNKLENQMHDLAVSNAELEQFAYIASHDLQEPLRMISSFLSQLDRKYSEQLDDKAKQYIHYAVDGAMRMRKIILDLLEYSRVGRKHLVEESVDCNALIEEIISNNQTLINETKTQISYNKLPIITAAKTPIQQVFQNLINNAIKYQPLEAIPKIDITCFEHNTFWEFRVSDNGIGIEKRYFTKVFTIFQRLHHRDEYSGNGIGLAICKKIVENHKGKIWLESIPKKGSTFIFTIAKNI